VGGVWPLVHFPSFELVFGRKREDWLAQCVAAFLASLGLAMLTTHGRPSPDLRLGVALGGAGIASIAAREAARGRISPLYLADALIEWCLALGWLATLRRERESARRLLRER